MKSDYAAFARSMHRLALIASVLAAPALAADIQPMILARKPVSVSRAAFGFLATYADGRTENWWPASGTVYRVNGITYHETPYGFQGSNGEQYNKTTYGWQRSGSTALTIRALGHGGYQVGNARYSPAGAGYRLTSPEPTRRNPVHTGTVTRMKPSRP